MSSNRGYLSYSQKGWCWPAMDSLLLLGLFIPLISVGPARTGGREASKGDSTWNRDSHHSGHKDICISCKKFVCFSFNIKLLLLLQNRASFGYFISGMGRRSRTQDEEIVVLIQKNCLNSLPSLPVQCSLAVFQASFLMECKVQLKVQLIPELGK